MPHVKSLSGLRMAAKYVNNWYSLLALYANIISKTTAKFKDGTQIGVSKNNYLMFYEELYKRHLQDNGFTYKTKESSTIVQMPNGLQVVVLKPPYSFVLDEIFLMKVYGEPNLRGRTAIDIGASLGDSALYFASIGAAKVYGFEPDIDLFQVSQENISLNNMSDKIQIFNENGTSDSLRRLILQNGLKNIFLKVDCEGCEYEITQKTEDLVFENITDIVLEYHKKPESLIQRLTTLGFKVRRHNEIIFATKNLLEA
jgi:16S rRNA G966 N2-methylase RsmD